MPNIFSPRILGPYKKYATPTNLLIGTGLVLAAYLGYSYLSKGKNKGGKNLMPKLGLPGEITNPRLEFNVTPPVLKPNSPSVIEIKGVFKGDDNQPSAASEGFYSIYDSQDNIITSGT